MAQDAVSHVNHAQNCWSRTVASNLLIRKVLNICNVALENVQRGRVKELQIARALL